LTYRSYCLGKAG